MPQRCVLQQRLPESALQDAQEGVRRPCTGVLQDPRAQDGEPGSIKSGRPGGWTEEVAGMYCEAFDDSPLIKDVV
jgi:hypothetical protein